MNMTFIRYYHIVKNIIYKYNREETAKSCFVIENDRLVQSRWIIQWAAFHAIQNNIVIEC